MKQRILVPCDYSDLALNALSFACELAAKLSSYSVNVRKEGDERKGIIDFAIEIGADLIAMPTHGRDPSHLHIASVAADVVNHSRIPVWTYGGKYG